MGYYIRITESTFQLDKAFLPQAYEAMCALNKDDSLKSGRSMGTLPDGTYGLISSHFAWMHKDYPERVDSAAGVLRELGFDVEEDENGIRITYYDSKVGDEVHFLRALAPWATGEIEWVSEEGEQWKYVFGDGTMKEYEGYVQYREITPTVNYAEVGRVSFY